MDLIKHTGFTVNPATNVMTFDKGVEPVIGSLCDGDTMYLQQGRICLDAMLCYFAVESGKDEEHCMWQIDVYQYSGDEYGPDFCNYSYHANAPRTEELTKIDTICVYAKDGEEEFKQCFQAYTQQMHKLITTYSTLTGI